MLSLTDGARRLRPRKIELWHLRGQFFHTELRGVLIGQGGVGGGVTCDGHEFGDGCPTLGQLGECFVPKPVLAVLGEFGPFEGCPELFGRWLQGGFLGSGCRGRAGRLSLVQRTV